MAGAEADKSNQTPGLVKLKGQLEFWLLIVALIAHSLSPPGQATVVWS